MPLLQAILNKSKYLVSCVPCPGRFSCEMLNIPHSQPVIYAIGDIHGRHDLLTEMLRLIDEDDVSGRQKQMLFLGDYIDRGMQSKVVIETLFQLNTSAAMKPIFLLGNHEAFLMAIIDQQNEQLAEAWINPKIGGLATLKSYGLTISEASDIPRALQDHIPRHHIQFLHDLQTHYETDTHYFAHAGVDPAKPLHQQLFDDLVWGSTEFLVSDRNYGKMVVHGHWQEVQRHMPEMRPNRIGVDTDACDSSNLTAAVVDGIRPPRFLMTCAY